ncbi:MAG: SUMF1/EgtB/PvdO family nonheme iron enzyme [Bryobacteraceae bacterium]|nr:SUMF1/EgtB/PvdO family nonheme iron enzyme [Bryobacteraceae bacterium]
MTTLPEKIGPYRILEELGRGAMGVVYRAEDEAIGREIAVKVVRLDQFSSADEKAQLRVRLMREARAAGILNHPGIVTVYQLGDHEDIVYVAMEFVDGRSLEKLMSDGVELGLPRIFSILKQIAAALDYAHAAGIVHRDIKPANILVRRDGSAKVSDFGIAKIASQKFTQTGMVLGTPAYMSPEQIMAAQVDGRADQFSLAVMAFQLLSGRQPFRAESSAGLLIQIVQNEPPPLHVLDGRFPPAASAVLGRALAKKPQERFASCMGFIDALSAACVQKAQTPPMGVVAAVPGPAPAVKSGSKHHGKLWLAVAAATAILILGLFAWVRTRAAAPAQSVVAHKQQAAQSPAPLEPKPELEKDKGPAAMRVNALDGLEYVRIPAGAFQMGCAAAEARCKADSKPAREVTISRAFYISKTEVTADAYGKIAVTRETGKTPISGVSWTEAKKFCELAGGRLPTEAEWEYAARAGDAGPQAGALDAVAWYAANSGGAAREVGVRQPNAFGLHDTLGNVWEWVSDIYGPSYYRIGPSIDPPGPGRGAQRVVRGGAFSTPEGYVSLSARFAFPPSIRDATIGFRCVLND